MFKRLAVQIWPKAPFLVPRSVLKNLRPASRCLHTKKVSSRERYKKFTAPSQRSERSSNPQLSLLREALDKYSWPEVESLYPQIPPSFLSHHDTFRIAQLLHRSLRQNSKASPGPDADETKSKLLLATDSIVELYRNRLLPPHSGASLHLLSIYKESKELEKGKKLWKWLSTQEGDEYVSSAVYGAAIEHLAYAGEPLPELETLYQQALIRFPGTFASYHLSPEAVVPDRGQPLFSGSIPILLLQGIFTARLLHGDWRNAYLAFDVALRLVPDVVPKRFFDLLMWERPLAEAIEVFKLACFTKISPSPAIFGNLTLRRLAGASNTQRLHLATIAIGMLEAQVAAGGTLGSAHLSQVITSLTSLLDKSHGPEDDARVQYNFAVAECGSSLVKICAPHVSGNLSSSFNALMILAGSAKHKELLLRICRGVNEEGTWSEVTHRCLVTSIGLTGDMDGLEYAWRLLVDRAMHDSRNVCEPDLFCLAGAVSRIGSLDAITFATEQLALHSTTREFQMTFQERCQPRPFGAPSTTELPEYTASILAINTALNSLQARVSGQQHKGTNWEPFPSVYQNLSREVKTVYNELTVDPLQPPPPPTEAQMSKIGVPFDVLRYTHWKAINGLLLLAERFESSKKLAVDHAIATREPLRFESDQVSFQLIEKAFLPGSLEELRLRILQLRGRIE